MAECCRAGQATGDNIIWCMHVHAGLVSKQWLCECASLFCYRATYIAFPVASWDHFFNEMLLKEADWLHMVFQPVVHLCEIDL